MSADTGNRSCIGTTKQEDFRRNRKHILILGIEIRRFTKKTSRNHYKDFKQITQEQFLKKLVAGKQ